MDQRTQLIELLRAAGIMPFYKGYVYLISVLEMISENPMLLYKISTEVYEAVAKLHNVNPNSVERSIRYTICRTWQESQNNRLMGVFQHYIGDRTPTPREFISIILDALFNGEPYLKAGGVK